MRCFANAERHLDEGVFVEAAVAGEWHRHSAQYVDAETVRPDWVTLDLDQYDAVNQLLTKCHVVLSGEGIGSGRLRRATPCRASWTRGIRLTGLRLRERWGGWQGEPFTRHSLRRVSVYCRER